MAAITKNIAKNEADKQSLVCIILGYRLPNSDRHLPNGTWDVCPIPVEISRVKNTPTFTLDVYRINHINLNTKFAFEVTCLLFGINY
ncbi:unnamed protein product [Ceutorhynchus assimilis]|uniref:Uncharacterized protein n=1 Tax=Ceutorhynchus assimilis TaxID=467358 RepID=A0A9N9MD56_9CUCU|nr:unnamed protein product [Ceutorhynchus assimilis]